MQAMREAIGPGRVGIRIDPLGHANGIADAVPSATWASGASTMSHLYGLSDRRRIAGITAFFGLSNRMANVTGMLPNPEFYVLGRVPKAK